MQYWKVALFVFLFFAIVVGIAFEIQSFNRYIEGPSLFLRGLALGAIIGLILGFLLPKRSYTDRSVQLQVGLVIFFSCIILIPYLGFLTNRALSSPKGETIEVEFVDEEGRYGSIGLKKGQTLKPTMYQLFFYWKNRLYRVDTLNEHFPETEKGATISLPIQTGFWGYQWVGLQ